jgi:hypothetical protein
VYFTSGNIREVAAAAARRRTRSRRCRRGEFLEFFTEGKRGFARARREAMAEGNGDVG